MPDKSLYEEFNVTPTAAPRVSLYEEYGVKRAPPEQKETMLVEETGEVVSLSRGGLKRLGEISRAAGSRGSANVKLNKANFRNMMGDDTPETMAEIDTLTAETQKTIPSHGWYEEVIRATSEQAPQLYDMFKNAGGKAVVGAGLGAGIAAVGGAFVPAPEEILTVPAAATTGAKLFGGASFMEDVFVQTSASAFAEFRDFTDEDGNKVDRNAARTAAIVAGAGMAGLNLIPVSILVRMVPGIGPTLTKLGIKATDNIKIPFNKAASSATNKQAMLTFMKNISKVTAAEIVTEGAEESVQIAGGEILKMVSPGSQEKITGVEILERVFKSMEEAAKATPLIATGFASPQLVVDVSAARVAKKEKKPDATGIQLKTKSKDERVVEATEMANAELVDIDNQFDKETLAGTITEEKTSEYAKLREDALDKYDIRLQEIEATTKTFVSEAQAKRADLEVKTDDTVVRGRVNKLDDNIQSLDNEIAGVEEQITLREEANEGLPKSKQKPTKALTNKVARLLDKRGKLDDERSVLQDAEIVRAAKLTDPIIKKDVTVKGRELRKIVREGTRVVNSAFRKATVAAKKEVADVQSIAVAVGKDLQAAVRELPLKAPYRKEISDYVTNQLATHVKSVRSPKTLATRLAGIQSRVENKVNRVRVKSARDTIKTALKRGATKGRAGQKRTGKGVVEYQNIIDEFIDVAKISKSDAKRMVDAAAAFEGDIFADPVKNTMLNLIANPKSVSPVKAEELAFDIENMVDNNILIGSLSRMAQRTEIETLAGQAAESIMTEREALKKSNSELKNILSAPARAGKHVMNYAVRNWDGLMDVVFNLKGVNNTAIIKKLDIFNEVQKVKEWTQKFTESYEKLVFEALGTTNKSSYLKRMFRDQKQINIGKQLSKDGMRETDTYLDAKGRERQWSLSKAQIRAMYMRSRDPELMEVYLSESSNAFTKEMMDDAFSLLDDVDFAIMDARFQLYDDVYTPYNKVYSKLHGANLTRNENYSPLTREFDGKEDPNAAYAIAKEPNLRASLVKSAQHERTKSSLEIKMDGDEALMQEHINESAHYIAMAEKLTQARRILGNPKLRKAIKNKFGKGMMEVIDTQLEDFIRGKVKREKGILRLMNKLNSNFASSVIRLKGQIAFKQLTSIPAYLEFVPAASYFKWFAYGLAHPKQVLSDLKTAPLVKGRPANPERSIARLASEDVKIPTNPTINKLMDANVRMGDIGAIYIGGWPVYKHTLEKTGSKKKAMEAFQRATAKRQQSADLDQLSGLQRGGALGRAMAQFASAPLSYLRAEDQAIRDMMRGKATPKDIGKRLALYHLIIPVMWQVAVDAGRFEKDHVWRAAMLGSMNAIPIMGDMVDNIVGRMMDEETYEIKAVNALTVANEIWLGVAEMVEGFMDSDAEEFYEGAKDLAVGIGMAAGKPVETSLNILEGVRNVAEGDVAEGSMLMIGYPPGKIEDLRK